MTKEVTTLRLLAVAYAKGRLNRSEYLQKRSQQVSALEFGQLQPELGDDKELLRVVGEDVSFFKDARVRYFDGKGDVAAAVRLRSRHSEHSLSDAESLEYKSANRLVIIAGTIIVLAVFLQLLGFMAQENQKQEDALLLQELLETQTVDVAKELNITVAEEEVRLSPEEYDELASKMILAQALVRLLNVDLSKVELVDITQVSDLLQTSSPEDQNILVSTTWFDSVVLRMEEHADGLDKSLRPGSEDPAVAKMNKKQLKNHKERRNIFLGFYADLADLQLEKKYGNEGGGESESLGGR